jgi:hypothetical protein
MTPQEKAEELFNKYATYVVMWAGDINTTHQNCKQCALIAVNEIAKCTKYEKQKFDNDRFSEDYWQEVKTEIEKI